MDIHRNYINNLVDDINKKRGDLLNLNKENRCGNINRLTQYPSMRKDIEIIFDILRCIVYHYYGKNEYENFLKRNSIDFYNRNYYKDKIKSKEKLNDDLMNVLEVRNLVHFKMMLN